MTTNLLLEKFDGGEPSDQPSKPFDIIDHQQTISEISNTAQELTTPANSTNQMVTTVGQDQLLPKIVMAIDKAEDEGRNLVDHSFRQAVLLIFVWMLAYSVARIIVYYATKRRTRTAAGD